MKKIISSLAAGTMMAVAFFGVNTFLMAASGGEDASRTVKGLDFKESEVKLSIEKAHAQVSPSVRAPACLDNYTTWNSSNTFTTGGDWSTWFVDPLAMPEGNSQQREIVDHFERDINGDGLMDYLVVDHSYAYGSVGVDRSDCVFLSNGSGWDLVYRCVARDASSPRYYGDCAAV